MFPSLECLIAARAQVWNNILFFIYSLLTALCSTRWYKLFLWISCCMRQTPRYAGYQKTFVISQILQSMLTEEINTSSKLNELRSEIWRCRIPQLAANHSHLLLIINEWLISIYSRWKKYIYFRNLQRSTRRGSSLNSSDCYAKLNNHSSAYFFIHCSVISFQLVL